MPVCVISIAVTARSFADVVYATVSPTSRMIFSVNVHSQSARVDVLPDGSVVFGCCKTTNWVSLDGIAFLVSSITPLSPTKIEQAVQRIRLDSKYLGCFPDANFTDLDPASKQTLRYQTPFLCARYCQEKGYTYAGVQEGNTCYCGKTYGNVGPKVDDTECNVVCTGDARLRCGGKNRNNLYHVKGNEEEDIARLNAAKENGVTFKSGAFVLGRGSQCGANSALPRSHELSFTFWMRVTARPTQPLSLISKAEKEKQWGPSVWISQNSTIILKLATRNSTEDFLESPPVPIKRWVHIAVGASEGRAVIFVDGQQTAERKDLARPVLNEGMLSACFPLVCRAHSVVTRPSVVRIALRPASTGGVGGRTLFPTGADANAGTTRHESA